MLAAVVALGFKSEWLSSQGSSKLQPATCNRQGEIIFMMLAVACATVFHVFFFCRQQTTGVAALL